MQQSKVIYLSLTGVERTISVLLNNKWIFLPASGYTKNKECSNVGVYGEYWSSTKFDDERAQGIHFEKSVVSELLDNCYWGFVVRPVLAIENE